MHKRQQIRYALVNMLRSGDISDVKNDDETYRIFANRPTPLWEKELPAIYVYTGTTQAGSEVAQLESRPTIYSRNLKVVIEIVVKESEFIDDTLDDIAEKVEKIIGDNQYKFPSGMLSAVKDNQKKPDIVAVIENVGIIDLVNTDIGLADDGKKIVGSCKMYFDVPYKAGLGETDPDRGDDLEIIHTEIDNSIILAETEQNLSL